MTSRGITKDKIGTMEARAVASMSGQEEMPTVDAMKGDSQVGHYGDDLTNGTATNPVSTPATVQIVSRMTSNGKNFTPITEGDVTTSTGVRLHMVQPAGKDVTGGYRGHQ